MRNRIRNKFFLYTATTFAGFGIILACNQSSTAKPRFVFKDSPGGGVLAKVGGEAIDEETLIGGEKLSYLDLQKKLYEFKMKRLNDLIQERLIGAEAKKAKMSTADYIDKKLAKGKLTVSKKEFDEFVKTRKIQESQISPKLKERIETFLKEQKKDEVVQKHLAKLTRKDPVEVYFKKPKIDVNVNLAQSPKWGKDSSKVTIIEFSDFQCPYCSKAAKTMDEVKKNYKGKVQIAFKHFPLSFHQQAKPASTASMCVHEQNKDKFWKFYSKVFENQKALDPASLKKYAKESGVNEKKFEECMTSNKYQDLVEQDISEGEKLGIRSTPTFLVNGELISGALPYDKFAEVIDEALTTVN